MRAVIFIFLIAALSFEANALAVVSDFLPNNTLVLVEGTSAIYSIRLQNPDVYEVRYKVDYDQQFMKALDYKEEYMVTPQSSLRIEFNVTAPRYEKNNNVFGIGYTIHQLTGAAGGGIPFLTKINKNFKLKVIKNPNKSYINNDYLAYAAILLAFLLYIFWKKNAKRKKYKNRKIIK